MEVSVIIPAYNAAETIAQTLESLCAQTLPIWEALVVDDGSTDHTAAVVADFVECDNRIRYIAQPHLGGCAARNKGIERAAFDTLLFLDADDLLLPSHLQRMTESLRADPTLDAVYCEWDRLTVKGKIVSGDCYHPPGDLFEALARRPLFPPFACILRRSLVEEVGQWDTSFSYCQDWDLWQRCARTSARFGVIYEVLGYYRMRPGSVSTRAPLEFFAHGLRVINQGYTSDSRVSNPNPAYADGLSTDDQAKAQLMWLSWCAGLAIGLDQDTSALFNLVNGVHYLELNPFHVADCIFRATPHALGRSSDVWIELWPVLEQQLDNLLLALEAQSRAPDLACCTRTALERLILENVEKPRPLVVGAACAVQVDVSQPVADLIFDQDVNRLYCEVSYAEQSIGIVEIPVVGHILSQDDLKEAITSEYAWPILGLFFERTVYSELRTEQGVSGLSLWREDLCLAENLTGENTVPWNNIHADIGWAVFLQEIWNRPAWAVATFYDPQHTEAPTPCAYFADGRVHVEVSEALSDIITLHEKLEVALTVGGAELGCVIVPVNQNLVSAQEIRVALTTMGGFNLCRLAVRQGLIGKPLTEPTSLRTRLATAARHGSGEPGVNLLTRILALLQKNRLSAWLQKWRSWPAPSEL